MIERLTKEIEQCLRAELYMTARNVEKLDL